METLLNTRAMQLQHYGRHAYHNYLMQEPPLPNYVIPPHGNSRMGALLPY